MALQILTMSALFDTGKCDDAIKRVLIRTASVVNVVLSSVHIGVIAALFWALLGNGIVATQVVEWVSIRHIYE
jgi:hypothetical protein